MQENPIVSFRKARGWSRVDLSQITGIPYDSLYSIERGLIKALPFKVKQALAALDAPADMAQRYLDWRSGLSLVKRPVQPKVQNLKNRIV